MTVHTLTSLSTDAPAPSGPRNLDAEQSVLGAMLYDGEAIEAVLHVKPESFSEPFHQRLFGALVDVYRAGGATDLIGMGERFKSDPAFVELGGLSYFGTLVDRAYVPTVAKHAAIVEDLATRRALEMAAAEIGRIARTGEVGGEAKGSDDLVGAAEEHLRSIAEAGPRRDRWESAAVVVRDAIQRASTRENRVEFPSGLSAVDDLLGGFHRQETSILAGRPGMAKSIAAEQIAKVNARTGKGVAFFSQEMGGEALGLRLACDLAFDRTAPVYSGVTSNPSFDMARKNRLSPDQWARLRRAQEQIADERWPLLFDTRPNLSLSQIEACARRAIRRWEREGIEPGPIIVDHLGLIRPDKDRRGSKYEETADISNGLAQIAKRLDVPVVALCQLSRGVESRDDKRPVLSDLRQAGQIEEDARSVVMLYRPAYYLRPPEVHSAESYEDRIEREAKLQRVSHQLLWLVAKNNNGPTGQAETFIEIGCAAIRDIEDRYGQG